MDDHVKRKSSAAIDLEGAQGRLKNGPPVAVIDIGSNSVRLVAYEGLTRSPTPTFNEKALCGLGRSVSTTGRLTDEAVAKALAALRRFRALCDVMQIDDVHVIATAAARDAANGSQFIAEAEAICRRPVQLISGKREARLSALGVLSGFYEPTGVVGDMGGGSLELVELKSGKIGGGTTLPLGGLSLQDASQGNVKRAEKIVREALGGLDQLKHLEGRSFYAVGGTWRALARLHMAQRGYPLRVMHGYTISARDALDFCRLVKRAPPDSLESIASVASERQPLLVYGALILERILRQAKPRDIVISAFGVREGLLFEMLDEADSKRDPLIASACELGLLRSRSPQHGHELMAWTDALFRSAGLDEEAEETRLRRAACHLADIGWRAHPDYRGEQGLNVIANAAFAGVDHPGRAFLAMTIYYRHEGMAEEALSPRIRELVQPGMLDRARVLGATMRVAYLVSAAMPGVLPRSSLKVERGRLVLRLPDDLRDLAGDRIIRRLRVLARLIGREYAIVAADS